MTKWRNIAQIRINVSFQCNTFTMSNKTADPLYQLIHSLRKSEKRNFKLYVQRNSANNDLKIVQLFDIIDKSTDYDEELIITRAPTIKKQQLSNMKAHLYKQILASLRLLESNENIDIQLHEQLDYARILYNKSLYQQSLKVLDKIKETARVHNQVSILVEVLFLEKKIETLHITRSIQDRANQLAKESLETNTRLLRVSNLSNLALQLYSWYINNGHARNEKDEKEVEEFFKKHITDPKEHADFYSKLYLYQCFCWYAFIRQNFLSYYRYTQKWVALFLNEPRMIEIETATYIKGVHNLLNAHFNLRNYKKFRETIVQFERFSDTNIVRANESNCIQVFVYLYIAKINQHFLEGTFREGIELVPHIETRLEEFQLNLDRHRTLVFYYKIASLYFGAEKYGDTIDYLNKIINWKVDLRSDLQCYARLLHLIAHYEIGNFDLLEYLIKSVYRFMAKMQNLSLVEEELFKFLRKAFYLSARKLKPEFGKLLETLKQFEKSRFETRAFAYLDIISWLESKVYEKPLSEIIMDRYFEGTNNKKMKPG